MCFNQPISLTIAVFGTAMSIVAFYVSRSQLVFFGCFYFVLMEFLQFFQYFWIDQCNNFMNKLLTIAGFTHIIFQPFFSQLICLGFAKSEKDKVKKQYHLILKMCLVSAGFFVVRFLCGIILPNYFIKMNTEGFQFGIAEDGSLKGSNTTCGRSTEWFRGNSICTMRGRVHLGYSLPMADPSYFMPGAFLHFFFMFVPYFIVTHDIYGYISNAICGTILFLSGPVLASIISDDLFEQGTIWCFYSCLQVSLLVFIGFILQFLRYNASQKRKKIISK